MGSISHVPVCPCAAVVLTDSPSAKLTFAAEVSTKPPSPDCVPPRAEMVPPTSVRPAGLDRSASKIAVPPLPFVPPSTRITPLCCTAELASRRTTPPSVLMPLASTAPELTTRPSSACADCADSTTVPSSAFTRCRFSTSVSMVACSTCTPSLDCPVMPSVTASPAASTMLPIGALTTPSFSTRGPSSATYFAWISPRLTSAPVDPSRLNRYRPCRKSSLPMLMVLATRPPTSTREPGANSTPDGLIRNTCPLALSRPWISDASLPTTRFSATEPAPGWTKFTAAPEPMLKLCQFRIARSLDCWMVVVVPAVEIAA